MTGQPQGIALVEQYLLAKRPDLASIDPDLDLIENRILDSLSFVSFLYVIEEQTGREILLEDVTPDDFRTLNRIRKRFFDAAGDGPGERGEAAGG